MRGTIIDEWKRDIRDKIIFHHKKAKSNHRKYVATTLIPMLCSVLLGLKVQLETYDEYNQKTMTLIGVTTIGFLTALDRFFDFKSKRIAHDNAETRYTQLGNIINIRSTLAPEIYDNLFVFVENEIKNLNEFSPNGYGLC